MRRRKRQSSCRASAPFRAAEHLRSDAEIAFYLEDMLVDGDMRAVPIALRTVADAFGGMSALAEKTCLSPETLYRTLSRGEAPRFGDMAAILAAFGLRLWVRSADAGRVGRRAGFFANSPLRRSGLKVK